MRFPAFILISTLFAISRPHSFTGSLHVNVSSLNETEPKRFLIESLKVWDHTLS